MSLPRTVGSDAGAPSSDAPQLGTPTLDADALVADSTLADQHEQAAHQKRNWVRLTFDCNDKCIFCLDSDTHDGRMRDPQEVKAQILDGRRKGAERLILSGGEPTIHPRFVDFIRLGRLAGYERVQTVTNGRLFQYRDFLTRCIDEGLGEITFSLHGADAKVHDALVGVKGAFEQEVAGLRHALDDGRVIVNIDICVNRGNVKQLPRMLETYTAMGVREYDLLHVIPFGNAWRDGKDVLFYDLREMREHLVEAFSWSKKPDMHIWLNRFPVPHCEGFHELIQDPYKLNDEIRGRKEEYQRWIEYGEKLDCRERKRCGYCYLEHVCDSFEQTREQVLLNADFEAVRVDARWESAQQKKPVFGGDPASAKRGKRHLPLLQRQRYLEPKSLAEKAGARTLHVVADDAAEAKSMADAWGLEGLVVELRDSSGLGQLDGLRAAVVDRAEDAASLLAEEGSFDVLLRLRRDNVPWLHSLERMPDRLVLVMPSWDRGSDARREDPELLSVFEGLAGTVRTQGIPRCISGVVPEAEAKTFDTAVCEANGQLDVFRFIRRYIKDGYRVHSLRCDDCPERPRCPGLPVNHIRAQGFAMMQPDSPMMHAGECPSGD